MRRWRYKDSTIMVLFVVLLKGSLSQLAMGKMVQYLSANTFSRPTIYTLETQREH